MGSVLLFWINPFFYFILKIYCILKNKYTKRNLLNKFLFIFSLIIITTYIPYSGGDTIRYSFKYYEIQVFSWEEVVKYYLTPADPLFFKTLHLFSYLRIPYNLFIIFTEGVIFFLLYSLLEIEDENKKNQVILMLYAPLIIFGSRFAIAIYMVVFSIFKLNEGKIKGIIFFIASIFVHKGASLVFIFYILSLILSKIKINKKIVAFFILLIGGSIYNSITYFYSLFPEVYLISKAYYYKEIEILTYENFFSKTSIWYFLVIFNMFIAYFSLFFMKKKEKDSLHYFLILFGSFIISFFQFVMVISRYAWVFNLFYVIYSIRNLSKINIVFKYLSYLYVTINILIVLYYSTWLYVKRYNSFPQIFYPTIIQILGYDNKYNEEIEKIAKNYPDKELLGGSLMANLDKYYKE